MAGNWIKLHRKTLRSAVADDMVMLGRWTWILLNANWAERQLLNGTTLQAGQLMVGMERLAVSWGCSKSSAYRGTQKFKDLEMITTKPGTAGTLITICNWSIYQANGDKGGTIVERSWNDAGTQGGTQMERGADPEEEGKNVRKKECKDEIGEWVLPLDMDTPEVRQSLEAFQVMRSRIGKPIRSLPDASRIFKQFDDRDQLLRALDFVIANDYQGLHPKYGWIDGKPDEPLRRLI